jgi:hypothetical protein
MMPMIKLKQLIPAMICSALFACGPEPNIEPIPSAVSSNTPSTTPSSDLVSGTPLPVVRVQVQIQIQTEDGSTIAGADVHLSSPSQSTQKQTTDTSGRVNFANIVRDAQYTVDVAAPGFLNATRQVQLDKLPSSGQNPLLLGVVLTPNNTSLQGRVIDQNGKAISSATVYSSANKQSVSTDNQGRFVLGFVSGGAFSLSVSKVGYQSLSRSVTLQTGQKQELGDLSLTRRSGSNQIGFDSSHISLGQTSSSALARYQGLQNTITAQGYQIQNTTSLLSGSMDSLDALFLMSPSTAFSIEEISSIEAFVRGGGKLIVSGEWAGFAGFNGTAVNEVLVPFGLQFGVDTLRNSSGGFLSIQNFIGHPVTAGLTRLEIYQGTSLQNLGADSNFEFVARSQEDSFRIAANTGAFAVVAVANFGSGKVILVGDTSFWSDEDSDGDGLANLNEADNKRLLEQILSW